MKFILTVIIACAFYASSAFAVDPVLTDTTCEQLREQFVATADAQERFADLKGSCEGVYDINGALYVRTTAVIRRKMGTRFTIYLPATDHTFSVVPDRDSRVWVGNQKLRIRDMNAGDELGLYLSVDKLAEARVIDTVAFATEDEHVEEVIEIPAEPVEALPTTG